MDESLYNDYIGDNGSPALMIMDYFERCELYELLTRVNETVSNNRNLPNHRKKLEFIPSRFLWRLFLCRKLLDPVRKPTMLLIRSTRRISYESMYRNGLSSDIRQQQPRSIS